MDGNDLGFIMRFVMGIGKLLKVVLKVLFFFGFGWFLLPIGLGLLVEIVSGKPYSPIYTNPIIYFLIDKVLFYLAFTLSFLTFIQNVVRLVKKDRSFSWVRLLQNKQKQGIEAKLDGKIIKLVPSADVQGVVFGKQSGKYAIMPEETDGHILVVGGAGSGKTAAIAIPTLMSWNERVFTIDIKGELYEKTGKARGLENIKVFNPTDR